MQTIFINGRFLNQRLTGVQRFACELLSALDKLIDEELLDLEFICLVPPNIANSLKIHWKNIHIKECGNLKGNLWEQIDLPLFARRGTLVNLCNRAPIFHNNQCVVIHDASIFSVPESYSFFFRLAYQVNYLLISRTATKIFTVSDFSKHELSRYLNLAEEKINVISEGCEHILRFTKDDSILSRVGNNGRPFFLAVGNNRYHKNLQFLVRAVEESSSEIPDLVIAGGHFPKISVSNKTPVAKRVRYLGSVTNEQLRSLYEHAIGFIFPSLYEGFGLPPLEAMVCGCPVLCSNKASLPEVCGNAAIFFDPQDIAELKSTLSRFMEEPMIREELREKGKAHAKLYSWTSTAGKLLEILKRRPIK